jgi:hypothetical protein
MISFPYTRTRRIAVRLVELTIGEAIGICKLPGSRHEVTATHLLRAIAKGAEQPVAGRYVTDPRLWTVEERTLLIATYLAHVTPDGPDFTVGGDGKLSDYVDFNADSTQDFTDLGEVAGKPRVMRPLLGIHAETLETLCATRGDWLMGVMACQLFAKDEPTPDYASMSDVAMMEWAQARIEAIRALAESEFDEMFRAHVAGSETLRHFFAINYDEFGLVCDSLPKEGGGQLSPARFLAFSCVGGIAKALSGRAD